MSNFYFALRRRSDRLLVGFAVSYILYKDPEKENSLTERA